MTYIKTSNIENKTTKYFGGRGHEHDITGLKFGKLLVKEKTNIRKGGHILWRCECDCGNKNYLTRSLYLRHGFAQSCGCLHREKISLNKGQASKNAKYSNYKNSAKRRNLDFTLTIDEFDSLAQRNCHYCNRPPEQVVRRAYGNGEYIYNGVDRVDNSKGYVVENCVPCCKICNRAKDIMPEDEFLSWIRQVYIHSIVGELV
jgi:hypothetical protein